MQFKLVSEMGVHAWRKAKNRTANLRNPPGAAAKVVHCDMVVSEFESRACNTFTFGINTLEKGMNPLLAPQSSDELNSITVIYNGSTRSTKIWICEIEIGSSNVHRCSYAYWKPKTLEIGSGTKLLSTFLSLKVFRHEERETQFLQQKRGIFRRPQLVSPRRDQKSTTFPKTRISTLSFGV